MKMNPGGVRYCPSPPVWWFGHPAIGSAEFTVLMVLLLHSDKRGSCFVGQKTAASYFRKSRAWANAAISRLVEAGLIERVRQFQSRGGETSCLYRLLDLDGSPLRKGDPVNPPHPATSRDWSRSSEFSDTGTPTDADTPPGPGCRPADTGHCSAVSSRHSAVTGCQPSDTNMTHTNNKEDSLPRESGVSASGPGFVGEDGREGRRNETGGFGVPSPSRGAAASIPAQPGKPLPDDWTPSPKSVSWAMARVPDLDVLRFTETFILSCNARGYRYACPDSAWRRWLIEPKTVLPRLARRLPPPLGPAWTENNYYQESSINDYSALLESGSVGLFEPEDGPLIHLAKSAGGRHGRGAGCEHRDAASGRNASAHRVVDKANRVLERILAG
jgi:hypothetical protein